LDIKANTTKPTQFATHDSRVLCIYHYDKFTVQHLTYEKNTAAQTALLGDALGN